MTVCSHASPWQGKALGNADPNIIAPTYSVGARGWSLAGPARSLDLVGGQSNGKSLGYRENATSPRRNVNISVNGSPLSIWEPSGSHYPRLIQEIEAIQPEDFYMYWVHGEEDGTSSTTADTYLSRLEAMATQLDSDASSANVHWIVHQLHASTTTTVIPERDTIRTALSTFVTNRGAASAALVVMDDQGLQADQVHYLSSTKTTRWSRMDAARDAFCP